MVRLKKKRKDNAYIFIQRENKLYVQVTHGNQARYGSVK